MIGTAIAGTAAALGSAIYGAIASSKANNRAKTLVSDLRKRNKAWYDQKMSGDYMARSDVRAAVKKQRELLDEQLRRARATNVVAGGTDQTLAMQQAAANNSLSNTMTDIAANAANYKDAVEQQYLAQDAALTQQQAQMYQQQAAQTAQAAGQAVNAGLSLAGEGFSTLNKKRA